MGNTRYFLISTDTVFCLNGSEELRAVATTTKTGQTRTEALLL